MVLERNLIETAHLSHLNLRPADRWRAVSLLGHVSEIRETPAPSLSAAPAAENHRSKLHFRHGKTGFLDTFDSRRPL
jgi:hypothetical protein